MKRMFFACLAAAACLIAACERHAATELEDEHAGGPQDHRSNPAEASKPEAGPTAPPDGVRVNPAGSGPVTQPRKEGSPSYFQDK